MTKGKTFAQTGKRHTLQGQLATIVFETLFNIRKSPQQRMKGVHAGAGGRDDADSSLYQG